MTNDKQRERLVELLKDVEYQYTKINSITTENVADWLLRHGVIVPPCKVGDTVYVLEDWGYEKELEEKEVGVIAIAGTDDFSKELWEDFHGCAIGTFADVGKTVFLTREEAEQELVTDNNVGSKTEEGASDAD